MTTVAIIQSRYDSTRLPGKAMQMIGGYTLLEHCYRRAAQAQTVDAVVVATGANVANQPILDLCAQNGWHWFVGSEDDVLDRYYRCAQQFHADVIVRVSGDSPLIDGEIIDRVVRTLTQHQYRYVTNSNGIEPSTYADGLDTEALTFLTLCHMHKVAVLPSQREHPTSWIWTNLPRYRWATLNNYPDLSRYRLCVDTPADLEAMRAIMRIAGPDCTWRDAIAVLDAHPEVGALHKGETRNAGYAASVAKEQANA